MMLAGVQPMMLAMMLAGVQPMMLAGVQPFVNTNPDTIGCSPKTRPNPNANPYPYPKPGAQSSQAPLLESADD